MGIGQGDERRAHMLHDPMKKLIPLVAVPSIINMLVGAIYNMADTFFVGQLGLSATGAVGIVFPIMNLLQALSFVFAHGANSYVSRLLGQNNPERAAQTVTTALVSAMVFGLLYGVAGLLFLDPVLRLFGATETILPYARDYAQYIFIASPLFAGSYVMNNTLRAEGSTLKSLVGMSSGAVLNIILDPICIFALNMGVAGAGFATMIGQTFAFCLLLSFYIRKGKRASALSLSLRQFTCKGGMYGEMIRIGLPSFARMGLNSAATILLNNAAQPYGDAAIAGFSVVMRVLMLVNSAVIGYGQGYQPISGYNYGAGKYRRVEEAYRFTLRTAVIYSTICGALLIALAPSLIGIFQSDPAVVELGTTALRVQAAALPFMAFTMVHSMLFQSIGRAVPAFISASARQGLCFVPLVLILPRLFGFHGLLAAQPAADVCAFLIVLPLAVRSIRALRVQQATERTEDIFAVE
ncbi:MATE family efflux transporter [Christensenellaceae bacterium OttesenSCG-928-L17]|nr:MATE family efflux transporter [Christensenellaceae bacterium OttesenSCG-928-L17]